MNLPEAIGKALGTREAILRLEDEVLKLPQVNLGTTHVLSGGCYARSILVPAGCVLTGATHKKDHINVVQGDITVSTDGGMRRLTGQHTFATRAGMKRAGYAHSETIWTTIVHTDKTVVDEIEADIVLEPERLQTRNPEIGFTPNLLEQL